MSWSEEHELIVKKLESGEIEPPARPIDPVAEMRKNDPQRYQREFAKAVVQVDQRARTRAETRLTGLRERLLERKRERERVREATDQGGGWGSELVEPTEVFVHDHSSGLAGWGRYDTVVAESEESAPKGDAGWGR